MATAKAPHPDVKQVLQGVRTAWEACCKDYGELALNSERCLQAAFYHHLRQTFPKGAGFWICVEARVSVPQVPSDDGQPRPSRRVFIDTLVCRDDKVLLAIELKYKPRAAPGRAAVIKDLTSLSHMRNQVIDGKFLTVELARHTSSRAREGIKLRVLPDARMLLGIFASAAYVADLTEETFRAAHPLPDGIRWSTDKAKRLPPKLGLCLAAAAGETATAVFLGKSFATSPLTRGA